MATDNFWDRFSRWRRHRPFWGGLFLLLSALELLYSANMSLGDLQIHLGPQGFLSYLLPLLLIIAGLLCWFTPAQRLFYGIIGLLTALYSFIGLNLGGFFLGMLLGIVGGALVIAWGPPRTAPGQELTGLPPDGEPYGTEADPAGHGAPYTARDDVEQTQRIEISGHDDRPRDEYLRSAAQPAIVPGFDDRERPKSAIAKLGKNPKALAAALIVGVSATVLVAGSRAPASADECPAGLPSRSASATTAATEAAAKATATTSATKAAAAAKATSKATTTTATATPSPSASTDSGNAIVDGINSFIDGVGNLLGLGDDESASPSTSPSASESASASPTSPAGTTAPTTKTTDPAATTEPTKTTGSTATASATASSDDIPCLGARVQGLTASNDDIPLVSAKAGLLETASLTMYDSTYDGVVELPTKSGTKIRVLKFSMTKAVNKPFSLTIDEPTGGQTIIKSDELTVSSNVKFYTSRFEGKLFGLIPVVFTPDEPPPLTLPVLWFTDAKIQLNLIRCDTLTGKPLTVTETAG